MITFKVAFHVLLVFAVCVSLTGGDDCATTCKGTDASDCNCGDKENSGTFSCPAADGACEFCARKFKFCRYNGTDEGKGYDGPGSKEYKCCDATGENPKQIACRKGDKRRKGRYYCLGPCHSYNEFVTCKDKGGREYNYRFKKCPEGSDKWNECPPGNDDLPRDCLAPGTACTKENKTPVDKCCIGFYCDGGKCVPECKEGDDDCKVNEKKQACARLDSVKTVPCKDSTGREFTFRYINCDGGEKNTWTECTNNQENDPHKCGATGATCDFFVAFHSCCKNFKCNLENKCVAECGKDESDCTPSGSSQQCFYKTKFKNCTDPADNKQYSGLYLKCRGKDKDSKNTWVECPDTNFGGSVPRECGITGAKCSKPNGVDTCCSGFGCDKDSDGKCVQKK